MANASQSIPAPISYSCWDTVKEWSLQNPNKIACAIAVIFTIGALVAHYAFSAALGWPVGIGVAGFVAVIIAKWKLNVEDSRTYALHRAIAREWNPEKALPLVDAVSVKHWHDGNPMLTHALICADIKAPDNLDQWIDLICAIDAADPTQRSLVGDSAKTPQQHAADSKQEKIKNVFNAEKRMEWIWTSIRLWNNPKSAIHLIHAEVVKLGLPQDCGGMPPPQTNSLLWLVVEEMLLTDRNIDEWIELVKKIDTLDPQLKDKTNAPWQPQITVYGGRTPRQAVATSNNPKIQSIFGVTNG